MDVVRLITLVILLFFASSNTVFAGLPYDYESHNTKIGEAVWDQKLLIKIRGQVKPSKSRPAKGKRKWSSSEDSNLNQWECNVNSEACYDNSY
ncbi:hypothetical protein EUTSA_v10009203mg [Eutrema salsugineum]|uniref:Leucine-rich repeat-containing N-terminal plant-type domain-containing protein n=1 Tax=Eutrema salsugineum TaxID=72664 RepID=V4MPG6_EUTSA|nr:hypothetical protein EUTSA_v10009203mg [Eutrema salsugineum]